MFLLKLPNRSKSTCGLNAFLRAYKFLQKPVNTALLDPSQGLRSVSFA